MHDAMPTVHTLAWDNIPREISEQQKRVFEHLGIPLVQDFSDGELHGA